LGNVEAEHFLGHVLFLTFNQQCGGIGGLSGAYVSVFLFYYCWWLSLKWSASL